MADISILHGSPGDEVVDLSCVVGIPLAVILPRVEVKDFGQSGLVRAYLMMIY